MLEWRLDNLFTSSYGAVRYGVQGQGPPLVLVHGTPWSAFSWRHSIPALARWRTVYYYDLLGYGQSEKRPEQDVSLAVQGKLLVELLDAWGLEAPDIVGHDFGGTTVLRAHLLEGRRLNSIALVDPVALSPWGSAFFQHVRRHTHVFQDLPAYIHEALLAAYVRGAQYRPMSEETLAGIVQPWLGDPGQGAFYRQIAQADERYTREMEALYQSLEPPVLILWGEQDTWIPLDRAHRLQQAIPASTLHTIPDAGHLVQEDAPASLVSHLIRFLHS